MAFTKGQTTMYTVDANCPDVEQGALSNAQEHALELIDQGIEFHAEPQRFLDNRVVCFQVSNFNWDQNLEDLLAGLPDTQWWLGRGRGRGEANAEG